MPFESKAQSRLMHAVANKPGLAKSTGVPASVAKKFVAEGHGHKQSGLPQKVGKKRPTGQFHLQKEGKSRR